MFAARDDARAVAMFPGVTRRTLSSGERTTLVEITLSRGAVVPEHTHPHEQVGYVVSGRIRCRIGDETRELRAGDSYLAPGGVPHVVEALEDAVCVDIFSPVREEFL
ncbi:MAG TPA: cupin domain-containing protein [Dehalococcoidia bacterium]|nr:cupin domain-containing protein [Dehalococcoidia bacterium]